MVDELPKESREKYWSELSIVEKVERMRIVVIDLSDRVSDLTETVWALTNHAHSPHGEIVEPFQERNFSHPPRHNSARGLRRGGSGKDTYYF